VIRYAVTTLATTALGFVLGGAYALAFQVPAMPPVHTAPKPPAWDAGARHEPESLFDDSDQVEAHDVER
jgi:hypothetical protein